MNILSLIYQTPPVLPYAPGHGQNVGGGIAFVAIAIIFFLALLSGGGKSGGGKKK
jgi:hypothetical protein